MMKYYLVSLLAFNLSILTGQIMEEKIVYSSDELGNYDIWMINPDGTDPQQITNTLDDEFGPIISHSGRQIAFTRNSSQSTERYIITMDIVSGIEDTVYTTNIPISSHISYYPNDSLLLFSQDLLYGQSGENSEVLSINLFTGEIVNITNTSAYHNEAAGDVGGNQIVYIKDTNGWACGYCVELFIMDYNGMNNTQLTSEYGHDIEPRILGDSLIVYRHSLGPGTETIDLIHLDGTGQTELTSGYYPAWSPEGNQIVYTKNDSLWKCNKNGTGISLLLGNENINVNPFWGYVYLNSYEVSIDFEDQSLADWQIVEAVPGSGQMEIVNGSLNGTGNYVLQTIVNNAGGNENDRAAAYYQPSSNWSNYDLSYDFSIVSTNYYNYTDQYFYIQDESSFLMNCYRLRFFQGNDVVALSIQIDSVGTQLATVTRSINPDTPYHVDIRTGADEITVFLDGDSIISISNNTFRSGGIAFGTSTAGLENNITAQYDNISCSFEYSLNTQIVTVGSVQSYIDTIVVPIMLNGSQSLNLNSTQFTFTDYTSGLTFLGVDTANTLFGTAGWITAVNETTTGLNIASAGANAITEDGVLFNLRFVVNGAVCDTVPIKATNVVFNTGEDSVLVNNGYVYIEPIPDYGDVDENGSIQAYDAAMILKHLVGLDTLNCQGFVNAEVSVNDTLSALDASLILQYVVDSIDTLPYSQPALASGDIEPLDNLITGSNQTITIPIPFVSASNVYSLEGVVSFDESQLAFESFEIEGLSNNAIQTKVAGNSLKFAFASAEPLNRSEELGQMTFTTLANFTGGNVTIQWLKINENLRFNNLSVDVMLGTDEEQNLPTSFALRQNYPNPFNPTTTLQYDIPKVSDVRIVVFDIMGREVTELVNSRIEAGHYQVEWDGQNSAGADLPTGMYFARMITGDYSRTIKMVLMK